MNEETKYTTGREYTTPTGIKTTLFGIRFLAEQLGRTTQCVRKWEIGGVIPPTPFRINGRSYYSKEHIDIIVSSAEKSKIKQGKTLGNTKFSERCYREFEELHKKFFNKQ